MFGAQTGIELSYEKILVPTGEFKQSADHFLDRGLGFNITVPNKFDAFEYVDQLTSSARRGEAVNTVSRMADGRLLGSNTDGAGLVNDLRKNLNWKIVGQKLLVLGAGGAVSGVLPSLLEESPASIHLHNRTAQKASAMAERLADDRLKAIESLDEQGAYDLIINGTSASLAGGLPQLPDEIINTQTCCYDMVYSDNETAFISWCRQRAECRTSDGLGMLVEQAALAFSIWFGAEVETGPVISTLRKSL